MSGKGNDHARISRSANACNTRSWWRFTLMARRLWMPTPITKSAEGWRTWRN